MLHEKISMVSEGSCPDAALITYILNGSEKLQIGSRPLIVSCPGGAYAGVSDRESEMVANQFNAMGYHAAILKYSVAPYRYPAAVLELGKAIGLLRSRAQEWEIDPQKIAVLGFSAGGHLAAGYCMFWNQKWIAEKLNINTALLKPNAMLLSYPVITTGEYAHHRSIHNLLGEQYEQMKDKMSLENQISDCVPPAFIWHTYEDSTVPVQNSIKLVEQLVQNKVHVEFHMFAKGGHGLSLANRLSQSDSGFGIEPSCQCWIELAHNWLEIWRKDEMEYREQFDEETAIGG